MKTSEGLRNEAIAKALEGALATGKTDVLYKHLLMQSGLPGPRANVTLALGFAVALAAQGKRGMALALKMATLSADEAPGASELEFLPMCGVLAIAVLGADDAKARPQAVALMHEAADDFRFRVREAAVLGLARIGEKAGDALVRDVSGFMDGFFQAATVLSALAMPGWLNATHEPDAIVLRLREAFRLADDAPRSAARYPGRKALVEALAVAPSAIAARHGAVILDEVATWAKTVQPELREAIDKTARAPKLAGRHDEATGRVLAALKASAPVPRDPTVIVHGTRGRAKRKAGRR